MHTTTHTIWLQVCVCVSHGLQNTKILEWSTAWLREENIRVMWNFWRYCMTCLKIIVKWRLGLCIMMATHYLIHYHNTIYFYEWYTAYQDFPTTTRRRIVYDTAALPRIQRRRRGRWLSKRTLHCGVLDGLLWLFRTTVSVRVVPGLGSLPTEQGYKSCVGTIAQGNKLNASSFIPMRFIIMHSLGCCICSDWDIMVWEYF